MSWPALFSPLSCVPSSGTDHLHLRMYRRVPLPVWDGAADPGTGQVSHRHAQHHRQPAGFPRLGQAVQDVWSPAQNSVQILRPGRSRSLLGLLYKSNLTTYYSLNKSNLITSLSTLFHNLLITNYLHKFKKRWINRSTLWNELYGNELIKEQKNANPNISLFCSNEWLLSILLKQLAAQ